MYHVSVFFLPHIIYGVRILVFCFSRYFAIVPRDTRMYATLIFITWPTSFHSCRLHYSSRHLRIILGFLVLLTDACAKTSSGIMRNDRRRTTSGVDMRISVWDWIIIVGNIILYNPVLIYSIVCSACLKRFQCSCPQAVDFYLSMSGATLL